MAASPWYARALAFFGALAALVPSLVMWGFTVDDALISLRYAHHLASGLGYRFNALGPSTDGVTPLPWAFLAAPLASSADLVVGLARLKLLGVLAWTVAGAALGHFLAHRAKGGRLVPGAALLVVGLAFPVGAWAASGMETGVATALATLAAISFGRSRRAAVLAGLASTLRPELAPWAAIVAAGSALAESEGYRSLDRARAATTAVALALVPFAACVLARLVWFGHAAPLALAAKPSDLRHGLAYAPAAALVVLTPVLALAPRSLLRASGLARTLACAACVHILVIVFVGGDWMPYARLLVPIAPSLTIVYVETAGVAPKWSTLLRTAAALTLGLLVLRAAPAGRHVYDARNDLIASARPILADAKVVAALDIGWVGAASGAHIVDLAGLTDPEIAALPGGHTSKKVDVAMLLDRGVDTVVVYGKQRLVEERLLRTPLFDERFVFSATVSFGQQQHYDVYRRR